MVSSSGKTKLKADKEIEIKKEEILKKRRGRNKANNILQNVEFVQMKRELKNKKNKLKN